MSPTAPPAVAFPTLPPLGEANLDNARRVLEGRFRPIGEEYRFEDGLSWTVSASRDKEWQIAWHKHYFLADLVYAATVTGDRACGLPLDNDSDAGDLRPVLARGPRLLDDPELLRAATVGAEGRALREEARDFAPSFVNPHRRCATAPLGGAIPRFDRVLGPMSTVNDL